MGEHSTKLKHISTKTDVGERWERNYRHYSPYDQATQRDWTYHYQRSPRSDSDSEYHRGDDNRHARSSALHRALPAQSGRCPGCAQHRHIRPPQIWELIIFLLVLITMASIVLRFLDRIFAQTSR